MGRRPSITWWTKEVSLSVIVNMRACGCNCHPSKYFACLAAANVSRDRVRCLPMLSLLLFSCFYSYSSCLPVLKPLLPYSSFCFSSSPSLFPSYPPLPPVFFLSCRVYSFRSTGSPSKQISVGSVSHFVCSFVTFVCDSV